MKRELLQHFLLGAVCAIGLASSPIGTASASEPAVVPVRAAPAEVPETPPESLYYNPLVQLAP